MASRLAIIITGVLIWTSQAFARFSSDEFFTLLQKGDYAIISAGKNLNSPADARLTKAQLEMRSQNLESELKLIKVKFHKVTTAFWKSLFLSPLRPNKNPHSLDLEKNLIRKALFLEAVDYRKWFTPLEKIKVMLKREQEW